MWSTIIKLALLLFGLGTWAASGFIAIHFIIKYW
jgi:hypothetical protein